MIKTKRVYEKAEEADGVRLLIDRLWPRGIKKEELNIDGWMREIAPSDPLRKWFSHDPSKWEEFKRRYWDEVNGKEEFRMLLQLAKEKDVTLVFGSKETRYNNATALKEFIEKSL